MRTLCKIFGTTGKLRIKKIVVVTESMNTYKKNHTCYLAQIFFKHNQTLKKVDHNKININFSVIF